MGSSTMALLGPTNTGKTHRAVERMLEHDTGMMGLPLRLLAREVYDRMVARAGADRVALVTGEEKRIPRGAAYWVCTVEAMPRDKEVDFVAIDEIQMCSHPDRGHVFTDRLLNMRGARETYFLGAATMADLVRQLVPTAEVVGHPRLSALRAVPSQSLTKVPARSAVVAFGMNQVYELAERVRAVRGGAAVVTGSLSPRTRNAQVALYQTGEVDHLIATDAIGMGLNLDVHHVAFAGLRKFDGRQSRDLELSELGQIAGRAGRFTRDGTFAAVAPLQMPVGWARAVEQHAFPSIRRVYWRNADLDFSSVETLKASLCLKPKSPALLLARDAEDFAALERLVAFDDVRQRARGTERVRLLWDVASVPDFRKLLFESHVAFLREVYMELSGPRGVLQSDWIAPRIAELDDTSGESEALIGRIAAVRTWTYVSHQHGWVQNAVEWQARTRRLEDDLSDALHEALMRRFVDHGQKKRRRPIERASSPRAPSGPEGFREQLERLAAGAASASTAGGAGIGGQEADGPADPSALWTIDEGFVVRRGNVAVGRLTGGKRLTQPHCVPHWQPHSDPHGLPLREPHGQPSADPQEVAAGVRMWVRTRFSFDSHRVEGPSGARGILYALEEGLGSALRAEVTGALAVCSDEDRAMLDARGIVLGSLYVYSRAHLKPRRVADRRLLACVHLGAPLPAVPPSPHSVAFDPSVVVRSVGRGSAHAICAAMGYPVWGPRAVRVDLVERIAAAPEISSAVAARWLQTSAEIAEGVVGAIREALGMPGECTKVL